MKQPKNQRELLELLAEQDKQIVHQQEQIRVLKQAMLRLEQQVRKIGVLAERTQGAHRTLNERVKVTEHVLRKKISE